MENAGAASSRKSVPTDDQKFVLHMMMGIYFGPDLKDDESPKKSALRRIAQGTQLYSSNQLAGTCLKTVDMERLYYYALRNAADQSVILPLPLFYQFFNGQTPIPIPIPIPANPITTIPVPVGTFPQLNRLFPPHLHPLRLHNGYNVIENIAFINDPDVDYIIPSFLDKFKRLTGLQDLALDGYSASPIPINVGNTNNCGEEDRELEEKAMMLVLPNPPSKEEWRDILGSTKGGYSITGSAANGQMGPVLGLVDIGESEDCYLFRVSLPGVKRDESEFECVVEDDGTVTINGVTTHGEKTVHKTIDNQHHVFEMQSQNICPPGHFSISFKLPGPVNSEKFQAKFGIDAILEGLVAKAEQN